MYGTLTKNCRPKGCFKKDGEQFLPFERETDNIHTSRVHVFSDSVWCLGNGAQYGGGEISENQADKILEGGN